MVVGGPVDSSRELELVFWFDSSEKRKVRKRGEERGEEGRVHQTEYEPKSCITSPFASTTAHEKRKSQCSPSSPSLLFSSPSPALFPRQPRF